MRRLLIIPAILGALALGTSNAAAALTQQGVLTAADAAQGDAFGARVALSRDTLVTTSPTHQRTGSGNPGAVYVFERPPSGWPHATQTAELSLPDGAGFPASVAISGDTIAVGAPNGKLGANDNQGAVYIFVKPASGWKDALPNAELSASDGARIDELGRSVAISGDEVVATAENHSVGKNTRQGAAYVFEKPASGWKDAHQLAELTTSDGSTDDFLGPVALDGDTVVAGAPVRKVGDHAHQGEAYVFVKPAAGWANATETARLTALNGGAEDRFGISVAVSGNTVVAGVQGRTVGIHARQGVADVFVKPFFGWTSATQTAELRASDGATGDAFGAGVSISGDRVLVAGPFHQVGDNASQGEAYLFERPTGSWTDAVENERLTAADGAAGDLFGPVGIAGNVAVVTAPLRSVEGNTMAGAAYVFGIAPSIAIASPADGATFTRNQMVRASYSCLPPAGATIASCSGPVADGTRIDTHSLGQHTFSVDGLDSDGIPASQSATYTVVRAKGPSITALKQSVKRWRTRGRRPLGTTFSFRLDQPARIALRFGRSGKSAGVLRVSGHAGFNKVRFQGRISRKRKLAPGRYTLRLTATNAGGQSAASRQLSFAIVRR